jgi:acyl carrier protein
MKTSSVSKDAVRVVRDIPSELPLKDDCLHHPSDALLGTMGIDSVRMMELVYALEDPFL